MVKRCNVILNNNAVTVINYDGNEVQIPSIQRNAKAVNVILKDGKYIVVDDDYVEIKEAAKNNKKSQKKATISDVVDEPTGIDVESDLK